ncbi:hypothetical protein, partial [Rhizobium leguminosarum]|uniref:hypothetical protein n=1 Tax=Rhizobium leguminosarum TaxID=384 RepID=UPI003F9CC5BA
ATTAAGVASSTSAVATMPIDFLVRLRTASAKVSTRGSSREAGYKLATDKNELAANASAEGNLLGLFHTGNMEVTLDREF